MADRGRYRISKKGVDLQHTLKHREEAISSHHSTHADTVVSIYMMRFVLKEAIYLHIFLNTHTHTHTSRRYADTPRT